MYMVVAIGNSTYVLGSGYSNITYVTGSGHR